MEVHAHTHTPRKKWTHYFWEFLMLFLAVFCGFLAENQREHYIEKVRAKQYARSLVNDLQKDTAMIRRIVRGTIRIVRGIDSLADLLSDRDIKQIQNIDLFRAIDRGLMYRPYTWNRTTLEQIKNSGSIRYFSNDSIIDGITAYDALTRHMDEDYKGDEERESHMAGIANQIVDQNYPQDFHDALLTKFDSVSRTEFYSQMIKNGPRLLTQNNNDIKILMNEMLSIRQGVSVRGETELPGLIKDAEKLIILLKNEYHLK